MVSLNSKISAEDEYTHAPGPEPNWQESMYYNFYDREERTGGLVRIGNRVNEGYAEVTLCVYLPNSHVLFKFERAAISGNEKLEAGGMSIEIPEPLKRHRTVYDGSAVYLKDPNQLAVPGSAFRNNPWKEVKLDLIHEPVGPLYETDIDRGETNIEYKMSTVHYEQHMKVRGTLTIEGETIQIDGLGARDHSWGPRYWQAPSWYRWLVGNLSPTFGFMAQEYVYRDGTRTETGVVVRGDKLERVKSLKIDSEYTDNGLYHKAMKCTLGLESGEELTIEGRVLSFIPLRNRRQGQFTHLGEGMTEYRCGDKVGYGLSEYLNQIETPPTGDAKK